MNTKLQEALTKRQVAEGSMLFVHAHPEFNPCFANLAILASEIAAKSLASDKLESWEIAFASVENRLAPQVKEVPPSAPEPEPWRYSFPEIHTARDVQKLPSKLYRDFWFDKDRGSGHIDPVSGEKGLYQKALDFRSVVRSILNKENSRRGF